MASAQNNFRELQRMWMKIVKFVKLSFKVSVIISPLCLADEEDLVAK